MDSKPKILKEVMELRGTNSKTYELDNGQKQLQGFHSPIHYEKNGTMYDIDTNIQDGKVENTPYIAILSKDKIGFSFKKKETGDKVKITLDKLGEKEIPYQLPLIKGNSALYEDVDKDIDILIEFNNTGGRLFRILKTPEAERKATFHIEQNKDGLNISPKFFGKDSEGRDLQLETKTEEIDSGLYIEDVFTGKTITVDEKTRVRSLSDEVTYPVTIDPEVSIWS
jgi:hypothetical protein